MVETAKVEELQVPRWFDRHVHVRDGEMMETVLPYTLNQRATGAIIMPNLMLPDGKPNPVDTAAKALEYRDRITRLLPKGSDFKPCMTLYLTDDTTPQEVVEAYRSGAIVAVKLYMADQKGEGGTTGSHSGVRNLLGRYLVFEAMEKKGVPLLGHFEAVEGVVDEFDREIVSLQRDLQSILRSFPGLPVVFEHLTDGRAADFVAESDHPGGLCATVTPHHLMINRNAMFERGMNPVHYCKPVPKREEHRLRVRKHVTSGNRCFGAGTDSAPHDKSAKSRCCGCAAGIFTAPNAVELYTSVFAEDGALEHLGPFLSENFLHVYGMTVSDEMMTIRREPWVVPVEIGSGPNTVRVFKGGETLEWKLVG